MLEHTRRLLLEAEIEYWKEMVRVRRGRLDPKMREYLDLQKRAEHRLFDLVHIPRAA